MMLRINRASMRRRQAGAAALVVVMVLFFLMALVAAYTSRNMIFEQRTSANNFRATQAFENAEAGVEWAIAMLGQGRIDANCAPTGALAQNTFRQRYLAQDASGAFVPSPALANLRPTCVLAGGAWSCSCPDVGEPILNIPQGPAPAFMLRFVPDVGVSRPAIVRLESTGCSSIGQQCYAGAPAPADAEARVSVMLALSPALPNPPSAALTARASVNFAGNAVTVVNADDASSGITVASGADIQNDSAARLSSRPGTPGSASVLAGDDSLHALDADHLFVAVFGSDRTTYRTQPAVASVNCSGDCAQSLAQAAAANPGRTLWVNGPLSLNTSVSLGNADSPVVLVVEGDLSAATDLSVNGLIYMRSGQWNTTGGSTLVRGAVVAENALTINGAPAIVYDAAILRRISQSHGSMVRVPGGWRDFTPR
jgi:type II secretory pathway pseudopilin PulG